MADPLVLENEIAGQKRCNGCGEAKPLTSFRPHPTGRHGRASKCKPCQNEATQQWQDRNLDRVLDKRLRKKFGITLEQYEQMERDQSGLCAICGQPPTIVMGNGRRQGRPLRPKLAVDHDHQTGKIRGLLCIPCNRGIGFLGDTADRVRSALAYLERSEG